MQGSELAELVGVCDMRQDRLEVGTKTFGVPGFADVPSMLAALSPDVCIVATGGYEYGSEHYEPTMQALDFGCHVLGRSPSPTRSARPKRWWRWRSRRASATASTSTTASRRRRGWPNAGKTKGASVICSL
ncbi:MAG: Gfo/Idh/MocA family oxidoreductase [Caldilineaceae bacterium]